jgi:hypothetical protein
VSFTDKPQNPPTLPIEALSSQMIEAAAVLSSPITASPAIVALADAAEALRWFPSPAEGSST